MLDTTKPMQLCYRDKWWNCRYLATSSDGCIIVEQQKGDVWIVHIYSGDSTFLRNKPEPKRRPLNGEELLALTGTVVYSPVQSMRAMVSLSSFDYVHIGESIYRPDELMSTSWRRLDGSGLWVEE